MRLLVDVERWFDWRLKTRDQVKEGDVTLPSHHGEEFALVQHQVEGEKPNWVEVRLDDGDIDRMVNDHQVGVEKARKGYTTTQVGGAAHGQEVVVPPRALPLKTRRRLIADHLADTVLPQHSPSQHVRAVRVVAGYQDEDPRSLERYLNRRLVEDAAEDEEAPEEEPRSRRGGHR